MSLARLENTIEPMAERVAGIHDKLTGDLDVKIAEILNLMQTMMSIDASPRIWPSYEESTAMSDFTWPKDAKKRRTSSNSASNSVSHGPESETYEPPQVITKSQRSIDPSLSPMSSNLRSSRDLDPYDHQGLSLISVDRPPRVRPFDEAPPKYNNEWRSPMSSSLPSRPPELLNNSQPRSMSDYPQAQEQQLNTAHPTNLHAPNSQSIRSSISSSSYASSIPNSDVPSTSPTLLPRPMIPLDFQAQASQTKIYDMPFLPKIISAPDISHRATATEMEHALFERELLRDSAILCEA